jgi:hypothetical protein
LVLVGFAQPVFLYTSGQLTGKKSMCPHCAVHAFYPPLILKNKHLTWFAGFVSSEEAFKFI